MKKLGDRHHCPKPPQYRIIFIITTARGQWCLSPSSFCVEGNHGLGGLLTHES
jgi:hypothetical protein